MTTSTMRPVPGRAGALTTDRPLVVDLSGAPTGAWGEPSLQARHSTTAVWQIASEERSVSQLRATVGRTLLEWSIPNPITHDIVLLVTNADRQVGVVRLSGVPAAVALVGSAFGVRRHCSVRHHFSSSRPTRRLATHSPAAARAAR